MTVRENISCNDESLRKLDLGYYSNVRFTGNNNNIGIQTHILPWQLLKMELGISLPFYLCNDER